MTIKEIEIQIALGSLYTNLSNSDRRKKAKICKNLVILNYLSKDSYYYVRTGVAMNPNASAEILTELSKDPSPIVRSWVATNPNTPKKVLDVLKDDESEYVRIYAGNPINHKLTSEEFEIAVKY